jgi:hypothetical protein
MELAPGQVCVKHPTPFTLHLTPPPTLLLQLFESTGSGGNAALLNTVIIGAVNVASTVVAILLVDK